MKKVNKTLILVRHAHRDKPQGREADNGLSEKGKKQARRVAKYFLSHFGERKVKLVSSAKLRCRETLVPLASKLELKIEIDDDLMESGGDDPNESPEAYLRRVKHFCKRWKEKGAPLTIACSHGDWIPAAIQNFTGKYQDIKKGGWAELTLENSHVELKELIQVIED